MDTFFAKLKRRIIRVEKGLVKIDAGFRNLSLEGGVFLSRLDFFDANLDKNMPTGFIEALLR